MGEKKRRQGAAARFLRQHPTCALCGGGTPATTREHFPPTSLFRGYYRPNSFVVPACRDCNIGSSTSDLLASLLSRITLGELRGSENEEFRRLASQLGRQDLLTANELLDVGLIEKKKKIRSFREAAGLPWQPLEAFRIGPRGPG
jgi:hypothetical protein